MAGETGKTLRPVGWSVVNKPDRAYVQIRGWYLRILTWQKVYITEGHWIPIDPRFQRPPDQFLIEEAIRRLKNTWRGTF